MRQHLMRHMATLAALMLCITASASVLAGPFSLGMVANTGGFDPDEMAIDRNTGQIYLMGFKAGDSLLSVAKVSGGGINYLYNSPLPGTQGPLPYTNGFMVEGTTLWWNNANAGPGFATELSRAPTSGSGPITRNSPTDDLDSLAWSGTVRWAAYYAGTLYNLNASGGLSGGWFYRGTSHLAIAAEGAELFVVDDHGAYKRTAGGAFVNINNNANLYRTNGSRLGVGDGYLWALDRAMDNGFWRISLADGSQTWFTDPNFLHLNSIGFYNGSVYLDDTGDAGDGRVWQVTFGAVPEPSIPMLLLLGFAALALTRRARRA